jgi:hypothetical protein
MNNDYWGNIAANAQNYASQVPQEAPKKKGNLFTSLLPTIGGVAGGALGTFLAPGAGTAAGGAGGAMLGKKLSNLLTGEKDQLKDYLVEGGFGAVGGIGKAAKGIKGAGAALKGGEGVRAAGKALRYGDSLQDTLQVAKGGAASLGDDVMRGVDDLTKTTGRIGKTGESLTTMGSGLKLDKNIGNVARQQERAAELARMGIVGTPKKQLVKMDAKMSELGTQVDDILTKSPVKMDGGTVSQRLKQGLGDDIDELFSEVDLSDPAVVKVVERHMARFDGLTDAKAINDQIKRIQKPAKRALDTIAKGGTPTAKDQAALAVKRAGDEALGQINQIKPLKRQMATLFDSVGDVTMASNKTYGVPILGIKLKTPAQAVQGGASYAGAAMQGAGQGTGMLGKVTGAPGTFQRAAFDVGKTQVPARAMLGGMGGAEQPEDLQSTLDMAGGEIYPNETPYLPDGTSGALDPMTGMPISQEPTSQYPIENFLSDVQRDPQNMKEYQQLFAMINPNYGKEPKKSQAFGRPSAQLYSQAKTGMASVDKLMNMIGGNSGLVNAAAIPGQSLPIVGGLISKAAGTNEYKAAASNILNSIARINTGAAMPPSEEAFYARTYLPQPGDDDATMQAKVQNLYQFFNPIANYEAESSGGGGGDQIMDALALGGYQ